MSINYVIILYWIKINTKVQKEGTTRELTCHHSEIKCSLTKESMTSMFCISLIFKNIRMLWEIVGGGGEGVIIIPKSEFTVSISLEVFQPELSLQHHKDCYWWKTIRRKKMVLQIISAKAFLVFLVFPMSSLRKPVRSGI